MPRDSKKIFPINLLLPDLFETISSSPSQRSKKLFFTRVCDLDNEKWLVFDIVIEGVSLVTNYRSQFSSEIRKNGLDVLIKKLAKKNKGKK